MSDLGHQHRWDQAPRDRYNPTMHDYTLRAQAVYWNPDTPACRARGERHAECLLNPGHAGDHYGNGYDEYGPLGAHRWPGKAPVPPP